MVVSVEPIELMFNQMENRTREIEEENNEEQQEIEAVLVNEEEKSEEHSEEQEEIEVVLVNEEEKSEEHSDEERDADGFLEYEKNVFTRVSKVNRSNKVQKHFTFHMDNDRSIPNVDLNTIDISLFKDNLMKGLVQYLGGHARRNCNPNLKRLKHASADNYLSGLKSIIVARCDAEDNKHPIVFNDKNTAKYRTLLIGIFVDEAFSTGEQLSDPHIPASEEDRKAT